MMAQTVRRAFMDALGDRIRFDLPLSRHTSLRIGGPADALAMPADRSDLQRLLEVCAEHRTPYSVIGSGFNVLVRDAGIEGVVILLKKLRRLEVRGDAAVFGEAGVSHTQMTRYCGERGLSGLEFTAGIPGTLGGWVAMNAGIGSRELEDVVLEIEIVSADGSQALRFPRGDLDFRYRGLHGLPAGAIIVSALLSVCQADPLDVRSAIDTLLAQRGQTQPLNVPTCGSVFRNPEGDFAGRLIEQAGLKGERVGGAQISPLHANFIANTGGASAADVLALIALARERVQQTAGIELETEVKIVGRMNT